MSDLTAMMWKEIAEFLGNRRFFLTFSVAVLAMGILPALTFANHQIPGMSSPLMAMIRSMYALFAAVVVVAQTAPDLVLHERVGHTLDYLLTTRLSDRAIFAAKVLVASMVGYCAAMVATGVQLVASGLLGGGGFHWLFLVPPIGRVVVFGFAAALSLYVAVIGTFVALRVGEQRAAYMLTLLSIGLLLVPFLAGWLHIQPTMYWMVRAALVFGAFTVALGLFGLSVFRRHMLVLYLQE